MRIVRFHEFGGPEVLKFEEVATPDPKDGEVLIRTEAIGVNFTDIARRKNSATLRERLALPYTPGVEAVGTVVGTGAGSAPVSIGTKVIAIVQDGAYSEYLTVPAARAIPVPPGLDSAQAVALPVQGLTAYLVLATFGRLQPGERVLIQAAAGGVGSMAVQLAKILGAGQVIAAAGTSAKLDLARSLGADAGVNYGESGWIEQVLKVTGGKGVDLALDMLGGSRFSETFAYLAPFGRIVTYGAAAGERAAIRPGEADLSLSQRHRILFGACRWNAPRACVPCPDEALSARDNRKPEAAGPPPLPSGSRVGSSSADGNPANDRQGCSFPRWRAVN